MAKNNLNRVINVIGTILILCPTVRAEAKCPVEIKLLLSPEITQTAIASLGLKGEATTRVYFFDTGALDLLKQGVIVRIRQGANNDLTVKVRLPNDGQETNSSQLRERFPCEIDRTPNGASTAYAIQRRYKTIKVPAIGSEIFRLLSVSQKELLFEAGRSIDWARVTRMAEINSTKWETTARSPSGPLALERWEWPAGKILELSTKVTSDAQAAKYAELERLVKVKDLPLSNSQDTKTSVVLKTFADRAPRPN